MRQFPVCPSSGSSEHWKKKAPVVAGAKGPDTMRKRRVNLYLNQTEESTERLALRILRTSENIRDHQREHEQTERERSKNAIECLDLVTLAKKTAEEVLSRLENCELMEWQATFFLARRLRGVLGREANEDNLWEPFEAFFEAMKDGTNIVEFDEDHLEERWVEFLNGYDKVRFPEGWTVVEVALEMAQVTVVEPRHNLRSPDAVVVASLAYSLQTIRGEGRPIMLPVEKIGTLLGKTHQHISNVIALLVRVGILVELHGGRWNKAESKAKQYRFTSDPSRYRIVKRDLC